MVYELLLWITIVLLSLEPVIILFDVLWRNVNVITITILKIIQILCHILKHLVRSLIII